MLFRSILTFLSITIVQTENLVEFARDFETTLLHTRFPDTNIFFSSYDFIVVGAGSGGCVVASRLSENSNATVLLLEAGDQETFLTDIPLAAALTHITRYNWGYKSDPVKNACRGLVGGVCHWPKGRGLGGTSLINFMLYTRGHRKDYDHWADLGNTGWSYDDVLPYFKKSENIGIPELQSSQYHGRKGPLDVQYSRYSTKLLSSFLKAGNELGYNITDPNGKSLIGFSRAQATLRDGQRCSTAKAFIRPAAHRKNLHISMKSWVTKILIDPTTKQVLGVEFLKNKMKHIAYANKEVILSAGTIASPQLLMLSGIGPKENLEELDIPVIQDLKVGYNLQDHVTFTGLVFLTNQSSVNDKILMNPKTALQYVIKKQGPYTIPGGAEGLAFIRTPGSKLDKDYADMEIVLGAGSLSGITVSPLRNLLGITDEFWNYIYKDISEESTYSLVPVLLRPKSRGRISLKSKNIFHWPRMQPNYMDDEDDIRAMIEGVEMILKIGNSKSMHRMGSRFHSRPFLGCTHEPFASKAYWKCCFRLYGSSLQHQAGTCKMGPATDPDAVIDPELKVYGVKGLRVADASIMPTIPAGHTNAIVIMIAEKASDMIKQEWNMR